MPQLGESFQEMSIAKVLNVNNGIAGGDKVKVENIQEKERKP